MEKPTEGPEPEAKKLLPIQIAYEQLAVWLGTTTEEVKTKFDMGNLHHNGKRVTTKPQRILMRASIERNEQGFATLCEIIDDGNIIIGTKLVGYLYEEGEVRIVDTNPRL